MPVVNGNLDRLRLLYTDLINPPTGRNNVPTSGPHPADGWRSKQSMNSQAGTPLSYELSRNRISGQDRALVLLLVSGYFSYQPAPLRPTKSSLNVRDKAFSMVFVI